jgi:hypothetical protein
MNLLDVVREVRRHLEENRRISLRMLRRQYALDEESLSEVVDELVDELRVARREKRPTGCWPAPFCGVAVQRHARLLRQRLQTRQS